jgi:hypothetical protein
MGVDRIRRVAGTAHGRTQSPPPAILSTAGTVATAVRLQRSDGCIVSITG